MQCHLKLGYLGLSLALAGFLAAKQVMAESTWQVCQPDQRWYSCVVDGDSIWYQGVEYRLRDIDAPERDGHCPAETIRAHAATSHLVTLLSSGLRRIEIHGTDRYDRPLVRLWTDSGWVAPAMIEAGHAVPFGNGRPDWCNS